MMSHYLEPALANGIFSATGMASGQTLRNVFKLKLGGPQKLEQELT
jgi:hypothetical protein